MTTLHSLFVGTHIAVGSIALLLFWIPVLAKKGSPLHIKAGRLYTIAMYVVSATALVASLMVLADPLGIRRPDAVLDLETAERLAQRFRMFSLFLLMLSVLVFTSIRHGLAALEERRTPGTLTRPLHRAMIGLLATLAVAVGGLGLMNGQLLLIIFGGVSISAAWGMFRDLRLSRGHGNELIVAHLNGLLGSGIGAYTAFFAFGGSRLLQDLLPGQWQVIPWVLPAVIGTIAINRLSRRYSRPATAGPAAQRAAADSA